ncbi:MAG: hypothetical protein SPJ34_06355 [Candidatus Ornithospirochaeta sp.]|nr:hypothetical protein [Candidatus Ornithospirochaeta sp.]
MLAFRRILEFSSRVHTYLLALYMFFALLFVFFLYFPVSETLVSFVTTLQMVLGWTLFLHGVWIILASFYQFIYSKVACARPVLLTLMRLALYFVVSIIIDILNTVILNGFSYGG